MQGHDSEHIYWKRKYPKSYLKGSHGYLVNVKNALQNTSTFTEADRSKWVILIIGKQVHDDREAEVISEIINYGGKVFFVDEKYY